jgi:formate hydrogenlyase subunit 3/multisubunit Na+/H+ antiporter MnhD subunit
VGLLLPGLVLLYLVLGIVLMALPQCRRMAPTARHAPSLVLALGSLLLLLQIDQPSTVALRWIPMLEPAALEHGRTSIYIAVIVCWSLCWAQFSNRQPVPPKGDSGIWSGLSYLLCGLAVAALTVNQFLVRVALLDLVALAIIILLALYALPSALSLKALQHFLLLRLGDLALLLMVLILWQLSGTFHIDTALAAASATASGQSLLILLFGLLAVGVKMGVPPFDSWLRTAVDLPRGMGAWVVGGTLPLLGVYLLYRLQALIVSPYALAALAFLGVLYVAVGIEWLGREGATLGDRQVAWLTIHGGLGLLLSGTGAMGAYVLSFLPLRMALVMVWQPRSAPTLASAAAEARPSLLRQFSRAVGALEERTLLPALRALGRVAREVALRTGRLLEMDLFSRAIDWAADGALRFGGILQQMHTGQLHAYVLWVTVVLGGVLLSAALLASMAGG